MNGGVNFSERAVPGRSVYSVPLWVCSIQKVGSPIVFGV